MVVALGFSRRFWIRTWLLLGLVVTAPVLGATETEYSDLLAEINNSQENDELRAFVDILNGRDTEKSLRAFQIMVDSGRPELRELALVHGIVSANPALRALAGQVTVMSMDKLSFVLERPDGDAFEVTEGAWDKFGGVYVLDILEKDGVKATAKDYHSAGQLQLNGDLLTVSWSDYQRAFEVRLNGGQYEGVFRYPYYFSEPIRAVLSIR